MADVFYVIRDECDDTIVVDASKRSATSPMVVIEFRDSDDKEDWVAMRLDERKAQDLKQAINRSLRESERTG